MSRPSVFPPSLHTQGAQVCPSSLARAKDDILKSTTCYMLGAVLSTL